MGCALPLWLAFFKYPYFPENPNPSYLEKLELNGGKEKHLMKWFFGVYSSVGIIVLGIGDALAAVVGTRFGKFRWPGTNKTFEGSFAAILSCIVFYYLVFGVYFCENKKCLEKNFWIGISESIICTFFLEAITKQIDNIYLPMFCCLFMDVAVPQLLSRR